MVDRTRAGAIRLILFLFLCSCSATSPSSSTPLPTFGVEQITSQPLPTVTLSERIWNTKPFGADQVTILFSEPRCVGYQLGNAQPVSNCTGAATVVAVQSVAMDSAGDQYTLIAGRTFSDKITVVAVELDKAENMPIPVSDGGFALVIPGARHAIALVPIDQFGNLVGSRLILP